MIIVALVILIMLLYLRATVGTPVLGLSENAIYALNANCADNAIYAIYTMPIVQTMPFMQSTQCQ